MSIAKPRKQKIFVTLAKHSGFCFGVKRAYDLTCVNSKDRENVFILGKLVHNNDVCRDLQKKGIKEINSLDDVNDGMIIFTAHGVGPELYKEASARGLKIIDTTCPKVIKAQRLAQNYAKKGWEIIIFGDKKHKEVKSIFEWSENKAKIVSSFENVKRLKFDKKKKYCLISQTTQNVEEFKKIENYLTGKLPNFVYFNTVCDSTDKRQEEVKKLAKNHDAVIVIGGRDSANSKRLYEIAKSINKKTYFIENAKQLKKNLFSGIKSIAVSAGASTPDWVIKEVVKKIKQI